MHVSFPTALVVSALIGSIVLVLNRGDRLWPVIAVVAAGIEALMAFNLLQMSLSKFRIDVILPGVLLVAGALCWSKAAGKSTITAATVVSLVAIIQLAGAIHLFR
jgi:hypothetical protein